ncbi:MAG: tyrosine-type recombinase/integrase [Candidatus Obscuribacterales bacterium]|nr:tyrosine-type recombinase/integrase [Candidatus Obscuribacterales bacterium]
MDHAGIDKLLQLDVDDYSHWLRERGLAPVTRRTTLGRARRFMTYLADYDFSSRMDFSPESRDSSMLHATTSSTNFDPRLTDVVKQFMNELAVESPGKGTMNAYITTISQLCKFCSVEAPSIARHDYRPPVGSLMTREEFERYKSQALNSSDRDRAIVLVLATSGIKLGQLIALDLSDVTEREFGILQISVTRGKKEVAIPLLPAVSAALRQWIEVRPSHFRENALFISRTGRLSASSVDQVVRKVGLRAGMIVSAETLRRTASTRTS